MLCVGVQWDFLLAGRWFSGAEQILQDGIVMGKDWAVGKTSKTDLLYATEKMDVIIVVSTAWEKSFSIVKSNHAAIAEWGWGLLNFVLCDNLENAISAMTTEGLVSQEALSGTITIIIEELNMQERIAGTWINQLINMKNHEWSHDTDVDLHTAWRISIVKENLKTAKWYTPGLHFATGNHALGPAIIDW